MPRLDIPRGEITWLVNRFHVSTTHVQIVRNLRPRMTAAGWTRARRKEAYRYAFKMHDRNRNLFSRVARGS